MFSSSLFIRHVYCINIYTISDRSCQFGKSYQVFKQDSKLRRAQIQGSITMKTKLLSTVATSLFLSACGQPEPIAYESLVWVNNYYVEHPVASLSSTAGGWLFRGARESGSEIRVGFLIPGSMNPDPAIMQAVLTSICPAKSEPIWQALPSRNKLIINVWTADKTFKDSTVC